MPLQKILMVNGECRYDGDFCVGRIGGGGAVVSDILCYLYCPGRGSLF